VAAVLVLGMGAGVAQAAPTWSVDDAVVAEGDSGTTQVTFTITAMNLGLLGSASIQYTTADGTATAPGDYAARSGTATVSNLLGGTGSTTVKIDVDGDTTPERDETFQLLLGNPSDGGTIQDGSGQATIVNDDKPHLEVTGTRVTEKDGAAVFTVSLDGAGAVTVHYATEDGSALAGSDYTAQSGTLSFSRTDTAKTISVPIIDDTQNEGDETFNLRLSNPSGAAASGNDLAGTATIADDDAVVPLPTSGSTTGSSIASDRSAPHVTLTKPRSSRGAIVVSITCPATETLCRGTLTTFSQANRRSKVRRLRHERRLGAATFVIAGGRRAVITTRLSAATLRLLRRAGKVTIRSYAVVRDASGNVGTASAGALLRRVR
jgi:chitinase